MFLAHLVHDNPLPYMMSKMIQIEQKYTEQEKQNKTNDFTGKPEEENDKY